MVLRNLLVLMMASAALFAAGDEDAVQAAEKNWAAGVLKADAALLGQVLSDDLIYTHSNGNEDSKQSYIDGLKTGRLKYTVIEYDATPKVKVMGNTAVLFAKAKVTASEPLHLTFLHVYMKKGGKWQMVAHQSARLPK